MHVLILGSRGIPARHGGFETFAQDLALHLVKLGDSATVYCQESPGGSRYTDMWEGIELVHIPSPPGAVGTILFDFLCVLDAIRRDGLILTLGYNTAIFSLIYRVLGRKQAMNMDGIEWKRDKYSWPEKLWLRLNEYAGAKLADHLIADHPAIRQHHLRHVSPDKITMIPYGAPPVPCSDPQLLKPYGLSPRNYVLVIARPEPDNSILQIVRGYSRRPRGNPLVVLGAYQESNPYHRSVMAAASDEVKFLGAIYDRSTLQSLRKHALLYVHGHRVGGTNPSLVESLAAGNAVVAHDNPFTRWVAGEHARYFRHTDDFSLILDAILRNDSTLKAMGAQSLRRYAAAFYPGTVLDSHATALRTLEAQKKEESFRRPQVAAPRSAGALILAYPVPDPVPYGAVEFNEEREAV